MADPDQKAVDDAAWLEEQGVPDLAEPFIAKYLDGRDALIAREKEQRSDHAFRSTLSPMAAEASAIVSAIRFEEHQTLWNHEYEDNLATQDGVAVYPGMMFSLAKERMEKSKLWKIVKRMPKGALLHCHLGAMGDLEFIFREALSTEGFCISADRPVTGDAAKEKAEFRFRYVPEASNDAVPPWSDAYEPRTWVPVIPAAYAYPHHGVDGFMSMLKQRVTIDPEYSLRHHLGVSEIWANFATSFPIMDSILRYEPIFRKFIRHILTQLHEDGTGHEEPEVGQEAAIAAMAEEIESFKSSEEGKGFWGARLIWTALRAFPSRSIVEDMMECIRLKQLYPDLICGYDFVGQEELGRPLADLVPEIFWFKKRCMEEGVDIPFYMHAGETLGSGDEVDENIFDAVLLGTRRIGHGFSLYKHPLLVEMIKDKKILIESCPISNEVLRLTSSIMSHPLPALLARGVPCCLSNDDPSLLGQGSSGLTHDFWQALQGWENLGLEGLASMAENSVRWASFDDCTSKEWQQEIKDGAYGKSVRAERMREWAKEFEDFCAWVVQEYGAEVDINTLD
ncbi:uncharacterized protein LTR77_010489 [Saxophila tyrrhenica]|uniref:adenosine deaminase n=1 Tax=Saxophila tyrrhenica TaxID=1690608 RepID=A0AAV9NX96_9PEZI|nr:hypothetical protein LTR77_010489 [Saxophila tyrrhenica]